MWNSENGAIARIFGAPLMKGVNFRQKYFNETTGDFDPGALADDMGPWSTGERAMVSLALELWGYPVEDSRDRFNVYRAATCLSSENLLVCLEAIAIRGGLLPLGGQLRPAL